MSAVPVLGGVQALILQDCAEFQEGWVLADSGLLPSFPVSRLPATMGSCQPTFSPCTPFPSLSVLQIYFLVFHSGVSQTALHTNLLRPSKPHPAHAQLQHLYIFFSQGFPSCSLQAHSEQLHLCSAPLQGWVQHTKEPQGGSWSTRAGTESGCSKHWCFSISTGGLSISKGQKHFTKFSAPRL